MKFDNDRSTIVWFHGSCDRDLEREIFLALTPQVWSFAALPLRSSNCWEYDPRRRATYTLFNFERDEYTVAWLWLRQAFGDDVKMGQQGRNTPGAHK